MGGRKRRRAQFPAAAEEETHRQAKRIAADCLELRRAKGAYPPKYFFVPGICRRPRWENGLTVRSHGTRRGSVGGGVNSAGQEEGELSLKNSGRSAGAKWAGEVERVPSTHDLSVFRRCLPKTLKQPGGFPPKSSRMRGFCGLGSGVSFRMAPISTILSRNRLSASCGRDRPRWCARPRRCCLSRRVI